MSDDVVYVAARGRRGRDRRYHTDRNCDSLKRANNISEKELSQIPDDWEECARTQCSDDWTPQPADGSTLASALEEMDPDELPMEATDHIKGP